MAVSCGENVCRIDVSGLASGTYHVAVKATSTHLKGFAASALLQVVK
jgi:hypothetical protein